MPIKLLKSLLLFFILSVFIAYPLSVNSIELNQVLDNSIEQNNLQSAQIAVKIIDSEKNTVILSKNADKNFIPASNTKLLTGIAGLLFLGKDFRFETKLYYDKINNQSIDNLYIEFSGDPSFTREDLHKLLISLHKKYKEYKKYLFCKPLL